MFQNVIGASHHSFPLQVRIIEQVGLVAKNNSPKNLPLMKFPPPKSRDSRPFGM
jgi:hypothetical protein